MSPCPPVMARSANLPILKLPQPPLPLKPLPLPRALYLYIYIYIVFLCEGGGPDTIAPTLTWKQLNECTTKKNMHHLNFSMWKSVKLTREKRRKTKAVTRLSLLVNGALCIVNRGLDDVI